MYFIDFLVSKTIFNLKLGAKVINKAIAISYLFNNHFFKLKIKVFLNFKYIYKTMRHFKFLIILLLFVNFSTAQSNQELKEIVSKAENKLRGKSSFSEMKITTVRKKYSREMTMKSWTKNDDYSLILIQSPARDKGTTYLKREKEIWYYLPSVERNIKMPPSMMNQSWMGTDLTNDDLVRKTSMEKDFEHTLIKTEDVDGNTCYHIELIPHEDADVIWGKVEIWVDKVYFNILKQASFDEDMELVNTMVGSNVKEMGGETIPTKLEFYPADKPNQKTLLEYISLQFNVKIPEYYFTTQYMTKVK